MKIIKRDIATNIARILFKGKLVVVLGPRQSGKTTLAKQIVDSYGDDGAYYDCQLADVRSHFMLGKPEGILPLTNKKKIVVFDEAQTIQDIGSILKAYHDTYPQVQVIATGSSSFDLSNKIKEPMTGRAYEFFLLPLSMHEIRHAHPHLDTHELMRLMQYGCYPSVVLAETIEQKLLSIKNIASNYLYKDIFVFESIRSPRVFEDLLKMLALQVGSMVSIHELAQALGVTRSTINRYVKLLEQSFIVKRIFSFSNNPRNEIKKGFKVFFIDVGVRNALIDIMTPMEIRNDRGSIFENFFVSDRIKIGTREIFPPEIMFWRSRYGAEIDVIEKQGEVIRAYECKWKDHVNVPPAFFKAYPQASFSSVNPQKMLEKEDLL